MNNRTAAVIGLILLASLAVSAGYPGLKWNTASSALFNRYPEVVKSYPCYFPGVNTFGKDSLTVFTDKGCDTSMDYRHFYFLRNKLVYVEVQYRKGTFDKKSFLRDVVLPLEARYKDGQKVPLLYCDSTKSCDAYLFRDKEDAVVATFGQFRKVSPEKLDWVRVKYYKRKFFDFKNQRKYCAGLQGPAKLLFR